MSDSQTPLQKHIRRNSFFQLVPLAIVAIAGAILSDMYGNVRTGDYGDKLVALLGVMLFLLASIAFMQTLTQAITQVLSAHPARHLNAGRAGALRFIMNVFGYVAIALITLELVGVAVGNLLIGGAALGIILGVAAQQALANFFAGIVLIITHPYSIGDALTFNSGAMGGSFEGVVKDIGLTHTRIKLTEGNLVLLPNATILSGTSISFAGKPKK